MRGKTGIPAGLIASLAVSASIVSIAFFILRGMNQEVGRSLKYDEIIHKTNALNQLVSRYQGDMDRGRIRQTMEVRRGLDELLGAIKASEAGEELLINQISANNRDLDYSLSRLMAPSPQDEGEVGRQRRIILVSQLLIKTQFISEDTTRLLQLSRSRIDLAQRRAAFSVLALIVALTFINALLSFFSARGILLAKEAEREQREWLQVTLNSIGDAVMAADAAGRLTFLNPVAASLTGWEDREARGRRIEEVFRVIHAQTREPAGDNVRAVLSHGRGVKLENHTALVTRDGREIPIEDSAAPIYDETGKVAGVVIVFHDVTEQRRAQAALRQNEEEFRTMFQLASLGMVQADPQTGLLLRVNEKYCAITGYSSDELIGKRFDELTHPDERVEDWETYQRAVRGDSAEYRSERRCLRKDGGEVWVNVNAAVIRDDEGRPLRTVAAVEDITERKHIERALLDSEARFRLLSGTAAELLAAEDPQAEVNELCRQVMKHLDCQVFFNFLVDEAAGKLHLNACAGIPEEDVSRIEWLDLGVAVCGCVARDGARIVAHDIFNAHDVRTELVKSYGIQAYACHPLVAEGQVIGTLSFGTRTRTHFSSQDLDLMKTISDQVAVAMVRIRLIGELQKARHELEERVRDRTRQLDLAIQSLEAEVEERENAQRTLQESEQLLRTILETMPVGVWITDQSGRISLANPAAERIWGGARYVGLEQYGEYRGWRVDTGERIEPEEWALARAITRGEIIMNELVDIQCFDGTRKTILNSAFPIPNEKGEILRAIVINQDITELRQAETELRDSERRLRDSLELLQKIVDGITDPLILLDHQGMVTMINKAAREYYGAAEREDFYGKPCFEGLRGRLAVCPECEYPFLAADTRSVRFERKGLNDKRRVESVTVYPVLNESGRQDALIVKTTDVTQAKILDRQILHQQKLASLGLMTSGIAHEINNPNSFIHFNIPILRKYLRELLPIVDEYAGHHPDFEVLNMSYDDLREDLFRLLENMEHGSQRINRIVETLKSFVRKRDLEGLQEFELRQVVDKVIVLCHAEMKRTVKRFEVELPEALPPMVSDPEALEQVILNLLINASHACDKEDSQVRLRAGKVGNEADEIFIEVSDNGSGIEEALQDKIFDPFFTTKPASGGTGLGLYICHHHVESLGGSIELETRVGEGSTFRVILPRMFAPQAGPGSPAAWHAEER